MTVAFKVSYWTIPIRAVRSLDAEYLGSLSKEMINDTLAAFIHARQYVHEAGAGNGYMCHGIHDWAKGMSRQHGLYVGSLYYTHCLHVQELCEKIIKQAINGQFTADGYIRATIPSYEFRSYEIKKQAAFKFRLAFISYVIDVLTVEQTRRGL